jgi:SAM-dependent methyltransferase
MTPGLQHVVLHLRRILRIFRVAEPSGTGLKPARRRLQKYLNGNGVEIGALHNPMEVDLQRATVRYVDRMSLDEQRRHYPELSGYSLVCPEIIASADALPMLADGSQDFVIANHLLEHLPDPIGALKEWYRVLRAGGTLFLALPDKRLTFDRDRPRTTLDHLIADHVDCGAGSRLGHFEEYSRLVHHKTGDDLTRDVEDLLKRDYSIHFHVWIPEDIAELLSYVRGAAGLEWKTLERIDRPGADEFIYVLQKPTT